MPGETTEQAIERMVQRLVERFDPDQIILFGSQARGTASPGSDVDLLVIMPVSGSKRAQQLELRMALLVLNGVEFTRTHQISTLLALVPALVRPTLTQAEQDRLTEYAVTTRYPGDYDPIPREEALDAVRLARRLRNQVRRRLPEAVR
jgi:predicted nucleotidyltransferase